MKDRIQILEMDATESYGVATSYNVRATPTMILFKNGVPQWQHTGALPKDTIKQKIEPMIS